jgi:hypothetical protein
MRLLSAALAVILVASVAAPALAAERISDGALLRASRCLGLVKAESLGAVDASALEAFVKVQQRGREPFVRDRANIAEQTARKQAAKAEGDAKASLIAERDGVCKSVVVVPAGS